MFDDPRWGDDPRDRRDDDWHDRDDEDSPTLGRSPGSAGPRDDHSEDDLRIRDVDSHGCATATRAIETGPSIPRDVFMRDLDMPRGSDREIVHDARDRQYTLRGS